MTASGQVLFGVRPPGNQQPAVHQTGSGIARMQWAYKKSTNLSLPLGDRNVEPLFLHSAEAPALAAEG